VADEGGFRLDDLPAVRTWLARVQALPGYVALMEETSAVPPLPFASLR
jgi:hypothetical protein